MSYKLPFGAAKGQDIESAEARHLEWVLGKVSDSLDENPNKPYADNDRKLVAAIQGELARRKAGGAPAPAAAGSAPAATARTAITKRQVEDLAASYREGSAANEALRRAMEQAHLVSPATTVGELPAGCVLALSQVVIDPDTETYNLAGKRGLGKPALDRIAAAAGISWHPAECGRLDDGSNTHYCHYKAVGSYRSFDGSRQVVSGEVEMDMREGSPQVDEIRTKAEEATDAKRRAEGGSRQILEMRKFLLRHAESKAKNRAIRELGLRTSYSPEELAKPFVVAKVMFIGHSDDPEIRREFARATATAFLSGTATLYPSAPQLPSRHVSGGHAPPPVGSDAYDTEGESSPGNDYEPPFQGTGTDGLGADEDIPL